MVAAVIARTVKQRPGGARMIVWLSLVSFFVLTGSIVWGLFGATRHGMPPTPPSAINEVAS
jgi:energy-coupling factor transporter transmembrane protein EcfT